jgi:hypothetical protein
MDATQRNEFLQQLKYELLFRVGFLFQADQQTGEILAIQLSEAIYVDETFRKQDLYNTILQIWRSYLFIAWRLQGLLPEVSVTP